MVSLALLHGRMLRDKHVSCDFSSFLLFGALSAFSSCLYRKISSPPFGTVKEKKKDKKRFIATCDPILLRKRPPQSR